MRHSGFASISAYVRIALVAAMLATLAVVSQRPAEAGTSALFSTVCEFSHSAPDDPIVFPNEPGASHLHDFLGNVTTDAYSTYESLRAGDTTCDNAADTSAYWVPALFMGSEKMDPRNTSAYYRGGQKEASTIQAPPANLRIIASDHQWQCPTAPLADPTQGCSALSILQLRLRFPDCWDGVNLDSPDHRSHMAYSERPPGGSDSVCPASHPVPIPLLELVVRYRDVTEPWTLASGPPATAHGDFFNAWDQDELERLVRTCINSGLGIGLLC